jgi:PadR family transcriptional regulator, regulatory protein AphA
MELKDVILGFVERKQLTGYELKRLFTELEFLPWSGNNNQVYTTLLELERGGLVEKQVVEQEKLPPQKRYRATAAGRETLRGAVLGPAEVMATRNDFLLHLASSACLSIGELLGLIDAYREQTELELTMCREQIRRMKPEDDRGGRQDYIRVMIRRNRAMVLRSELDWLAELRKGLSSHDAPRARGKGERA